MAAVSHDGGFFMDARTTSDNPLGLNLDFLYGRGYLWAKDERVSDWVTLRHLRMEIPDLSFPFDVRGGLDRFQNTRCLVRELELEISQVGLGDLLRSAAVDLEGFEDVEVRFLDGVALVSARVRAFGGSSFFTFRVAALRPEPADSDIIRLVPYDYRAYGPLPCPVRQLGHTFVSRLLQSDHVASLGAGTSFSIDADGDVLLVRPLKLVLLHVFTPRGWKLPNLARVGVDEIGFQPGVAKLRAVSDEDETWSGSASDVHGPELGRALAADEARRLFGAGDEQLFAGRPEQALATYQSFQDRYRTHPGLVRRLLDVLLADPSPGNVAEARALCNDLSERNPDSIVSAMGEARLAEIDEDPDAIIAAYEHLVDLLQDADDTTDRALCEVVLSAHLAESEPDRAADRLADVLRSRPRCRPALEALRQIYARTDRRAELEDTLKRLTGVAPDDSALVQTYVDLARHLMQQNEVAEARVFLERARRLDAAHFGVLDALAATWVLQGDAARAIKTLGAAADRATERGDDPAASRLLFRTARLWNDALKNREQALLQVRRAIELWESGGANDPLQLARQLRYAARLCGDDSDAIAYWTEALAALQLAEARVSGDERLEVRRSLAATHRDIAEAYRSRGRDDIAANHERRLVEMDPTDLEAIDALEDHHRSRNDVARFAAILQDAIERIGPNPESLELRTRLAQLQVDAGQTEAASRTLEKALEVAPSSGRVRGLIARLDELENQEATRLDEDSDWTMSAGSSARSRDFERDDDATMMMKDAVLADGDETDAPWKKRPSSLGADPEVETLEVERRPPQENSELAEESSFGVAGEPGETPQFDARPDKTKPRLVVDSDPLTDDDEQDGESLAVPELDSSDPASPGFQQLVDLVDETNDEEEQQEQEEQDQREDDTSSAVASFRQQFEKATKRPPPLPDLEDVAADSTLARVLRRAPTAAPGADFEGEDTVRQPAPDRDDRDDGEQGGDAPDPEQLEAAVEVARQSDDPEATADALQTLLEHGELTETRRAALEFEVGELLYYDLEESDRALDHLLAVRRLDPDGYGARPGVLNAIEAIYEERGSVEGRIEILQTRLDRAESRDMADTYRLLLAQLEWEAHRDHDAVDARLEAVLDHDDRHEGAHRLLAEIAEEREAWEDAAEHLRIALSVAGDGLDSVELRRRMADLLLEKLDDPDRALKHYQQVMQAAPGDSYALMGIRSCYAAQGDWDHYVDNLAEELRLLLGLTLDADGGLDWLDGLQADDVASALRTPASQILSDIAEVVEEHLDDLDLAHRLWGTVVELWPENVPGLERRIDLDRKLDHHDALADDLEEYAAMLLDAQARFDALVESARLRTEALGDEQRARELFTEAVDAAESMDEPPGDLEAVRETLRGLQEHGTKLPG